MLAQIEKETLSYFIIPLQCFYIESFCASKFTATNKDNPLNKAILSYRIYARRGKVGHGQVSSEYILALYFLLQLRKTIAYFTALRNTIFAQCKRLAECKKSNILTLPGISHFQFQRKVMRGLRQAVVKQKYYVI